MGPFGRRRLPSRGFPIFLLFRLDPHFHRTTTPYCFSLDVLANPNPTKISVSPHLGVRPPWEKTVFVCECQLPA